MTRSGAVQDTVVSIVGVGVRGLGEDERPSAPWNVDHGLWLADLVSLLGFLASTTEQDEMEDSVPNCQSRSRRRPASSDSGVGKPKGWLPGRE